MIGLLYPSPYPSSAQSLFKDSVVIQKVDTTDIKIGRFVFSGF